MKEAVREKVKSVVYSFEGRWKASLTAGEVKVFFRKRRPVDTPSRVFIYVGVPVKKIIGFAEVKKVEPIKLSSAIKIKKIGAITESELTSYIGRDKTVHAIWIDELTLLPDHFTLSDLNERHGFNPPQSFSNVSQDLESYLLGGLK